MAYHDGDPKIRIHIIGALKGCRLNKAGWIRVRCWWSWCESKLNSDLMHFRFELGYDPLHNDFEDGVYMRKPWSEVECQILFSNSNIWTKHKMSRIFSSILVILSIWSSYVLASLQIVLKISILLQCKCLHFLGAWCNMDSFWPQSTHSSSWRWNRPSRVDLVRNNFPYSLLSWSPLLKLLGRREQIQWE